MSGDAKVTTVSPGMKYIVVMENTRRVWQQIYTGNNHSYKVSQLTTENTEYRYRVCAISVVGQGPFSSVFAEAAINDLELWHKLEKISEERWRSCLFCTWEIRAPPLIFDSSFGNLGIVLGQSGIPRKSYYWLLTLTPPEDDKVSNYSQILSKENTMRNNILTSSWSREEKVSRITYVNLLWKVEFK